MEKVFELSAQMNSDALANFHYVEEHGADFLITGGFQFETGFDLNYLPGKSVNLSSKSQTLQQSYSVAKHIFEHVKPGMIKFVLIDFTIHSFDDSAKSKAKLLTIDELKENLRILEGYIKLCLEHNTKPICITLPVEPTFRKSYKTDIVAHFRQTINAFNKKYKSRLIDFTGIKLVGEYFSDIVHLNSTGAKAISALISAKLCLWRLISIKELLNLNIDYFNVLSKTFPDDNKVLTAHIFSELAYNDFKRLSETLPEDECKNLMARAFSDMTYDHLAQLSNLLSKDDYNDIAARIFEISAEKLRHKSKIKVGFYFAYSSMWFGDDLYNLFARNERFEPTLFVSTKSSNAVISEEFSQDAERFIAHGINVFDLNDKTQTIPTQDLLFCLTPYQGSIPTPFRLINLKLTTLLINFPYTFSVCDRGGLLGSAFVRVLWRMFFPSTILLNLCQEKSKVGMARGFYSGYPKMDVFFRKDADFKFDWKMKRPDAKKIIWSPHHSITNSGPVLATFHWNYQFMYEFAKAHPEISWVVKTHPHLPVKAISNKIFPSIKAYEAYMQKWDDLPNAQVYYGAYYQAIFATSDGMIQDCASFVAEYQYVDKPMIFLTRDTQKFNELGKTILSVSYLVDGKDLDAIAAMIQRVFIDGDDYKAAERREVFDKCLNYPKANGMLASEFIFKNITNKIKEIK